MRVPRVRFTVRRMMVAVVVAAVLMMGAREVRRPYPIWWFSSAAYYVLWSNNTATMVQFGPHELVLRESRFATLVRWPNGTYSVYVHFP